MAKVSSRMAMSSVKKIATPLMNQNSASTWGAIVEACSGRRRKPGSGFSTEALLRRLLRGGGDALGGCLHMLGRRGSCRARCGRLAWRLPQRALVGHSWPAGPPQPAARPEQSQQGEHQQPAEAYGFQHVERVFPCHGVILVAHEKVLAQGRPLG